MTHPTEPTPALGTAFVAAVQPIRTDTLIETDTAGRSTGSFYIDVDGQPGPVCRAAPAGGARLPISPPA